MVRILFTTCSVMKITAYYPHLVLDASSSTRRECFQHRVPAIGSSPHCELSGLSKSMVGQQTWREPEFACKRNMFDSAMESEENFNDYHWNFPRLRKYSGKHEIPKFCRMNFMTLWMHSTDLKTDVDDHWQNCRNECGNKDQNKSHR